MSDVEFTGGLICYCFYVKYSPTPVIRTPLGKEVLQAVLISEIVLIIQMRLFWLYTYYKHKNMYDGRRLKAFTLHTVHHDVPLCAYIDHVRRHTNTCTLLSRRVCDFRENTIFFKQTPRSELRSDNRGTDNRGRTVLPFCLLALCIFLNLFTSYTSWRFFQWPSTTAGDRGLLDVLVFPHHQIKTTCPTKVQRRQGDKSQGTTPSN